MGILNPSLSSAAGRTASLAPSPLSLGGVALAHVLLAVLLASLVPTERLAEMVRPLTVRVLEPVAEAPQPPRRPEPPPPQAKPQARTPVAPPPVLTAAPAAPAPAAEFAVVPQPMAAPAPAPSVPAASTSPVHPASVTPPRFDADYLNNPKPVYPTAARRLGEEGKVVLRVHVTPEGRAGEIELRTPSGHARLDNAAREAVAQWRFVPARQGDEAVAAWVLVPIVFSLQG